MTVINMTVLGDNQTGSTGMGKYRVVDTDDDRTIASFDTRAEAWKFIDKLDGSDVDGCAARHSWSAEQYLKT